MHGGRYRNPSRDDLAGDGFLGGRILRLFVGRRTDRIANSVVARPNERYTNIPADGDLLNSRVCVKTRAFVVPRVSEEKPKRLNLFFKLLFIRTNNGRPFLSFCLSRVVCVAHVIRTNKIVTGCTGGGGIFLAKKFSRRNSHTQISHKAFYSSFTYKIIVSNWNGP